MSDIAIRVENLSKLYRIGRAQERHDTLRDALVSAVRAPWERLRRGRRADDDEEDTIWALKDVSFEVKRGEVVGVIGRNGAGKTTLLKILSRITEPTSGRAVINGRVGSLLEVGTGFHPELTGRENIYLSGAILGMQREEIDRKFDEIVDFSGVEKFIDTPLKRYSSGMQVRLGFAVAAHLDPEILLVDEVLAVGDAEFQKKCLGKMGKVAGEGRTVLFVSHNMGAINALCERTILLNLGRIQAIGVTEQVVNAYTSTIYQYVHSNDDILPKFNRLHGAGITACSVTIEPDANDDFALEVALDVNSTTKLHNIGVGIAISYVDGTKVSILGPSVTNYVMPELDGYRHCTFRCRNICKYLAGGDYFLSIWLSKPRIEYIVKVDEAAIFTIPSSDVFLSGVFFQARQHGFVPLPFQFRTW